METQVAITFTGANLNEVVAGAQKFVLANANQVGKTAAQAAATTKKKAAPIVETEEVEDLDLMDGDAEETDDQELSFDDVEEPEEKPKAKKAAKLTMKDVNAAAMTYAKKHTKAKTLELLKKKFKAQSILELKEEQFGPAIAALKV